MNKFITTITNIQNKENLHIVKCDYFNTTLEMLSLELKPNIKIGSKIILGVKSTNIGIAKDFKGAISYSNRLNVTIKNRTDGELLSSIILDINDTLLEAIITLQSAKEMNLKIYDEVTIFINSSDLSIFEVLKND